MWGVSLGCTVDKIEKSTLRDKRAQAMPNVYHSSHHVPHTMAGQAGEDVEVLSGRTTSYEEATAEGRGAPAPDTTIDLSGKDRKKVCVHVFVFACLCAVCMCDTSHRPTLALAHTPRITCE